MKKMLDALWRAAAYCLYPSVLALSLLPLLLLGAATGGLAWWGWQPAMQAMRGWLAVGWLQAAFSRVLDLFGVAGWGDALPTLLLLLLATPVLVLACLALVTLLALPAIVRLVAQRRFAGLQQQGTGMWASMVWSLGYTVLALVIMVVTIPLWLIPPLMLVLPPLIWGWLASKVMTQDVLADYATAQERDAIVKQHRLPLLAMGVATGLLGSAPSVVWASGILFVGLFVVLVPVAIWIYTMVFIFSALWFSHFCLDALQALRNESAAPQAVVENAPSTKNPF